MSTQPDSGGAHREQVTDPSLSDNQRTTQTPAETRTSPETRQPDVHRPTAATAPAHDHRDHVRDHDDRDTLTRQKDRFGGFKWGAAFFGWLTAIGTLVLLTH